MGRVFKPIVGLIVALIIAAVGFVALSQRVHPFTESLQRQDSLEEDVGPSRSSISMRFANDGGNVSLASEVMVRELDNRMYNVSVRTSHTDGDPTHLDAIRLRLNPGQQHVPEVALKTPGGHPWEPIHFQRTTDGQGIVLDAPDLGVQGTGTVSLDFLVGPYGEGDIPDQIWLGINARMHTKDRLNLTSYEADAQIEVPMPTRDEPALEPASPAT